jgi:hypothetical protein
MSSMMEAEGKLAAMPACHCWQLHPVTAEVAATGKNLLTNC